MKIIGNKSLSSFVDKILLIVLIALIIVTIGWGIISLYSSFNGENISFLKEKTFQNNSFGGLRFRIENNDNIKLSTSFKFLSFFYMLNIIYIIYNLKRIFQNLKNKILFCYNNSKWLGQIGIGIIILAVISSFLNLSVGWILHEYLISKNVNVDVVFNFNIINIFIGLIIFIFSKVYKKATDIAEEQKLTI